MSKFKVGDKVNYTPSNTVCKIVKIAVEEDDYGNQIEFFDVFHAGYTSTRIKSTLFEPIKKKQIKFEDLIL